MAPSSGIARILTRDEQICLGHDEDLHGRDGAVPPPLVQTSLFVRPSFQALLDGLAAEHTNYVYTRGQNPTVEVLERKLAALEQGEACKGFASGMAAISAVFLGLLQQGDHVLFANQIYGPTLQLAAHLERFGITHTVAPGRDVAAVEQALRPETRLLYLESPGTMLFHLLDLKALAALARSRGVLTVMDNTWATPLFQKPIPVGIDVVVHACSKYIGGHSDVIAGAVITRAALLEQIFYNAFLLNGGILAPFDAWLLIRGIRTLPVRMRHHHRDGLAVARFLEAHPAVQEVYHPALHPASQPLVQQLSGYAGLFSFALKTDRFDDLCRFIDGLRLFRTGVSWGGVESLVVSPNRGTNADAWKALGIPPSLVRLSVGLEGSDALIEDLDQALAALPA